MDLKYVLLKDCCSKIGSGATPKGGKSVYIERGTSFIRSQNVYNLFFSTKGLAYINDDAANKLKGVTVREGDVLLNITGDSVARTCVVPNEVLPARVNQHVAIIRTNHSLDPYYLNYYLASPAMQGYLLNIASTGASRNAITKGAIEKLSIPTPSLDVQRRIASILSAYDNLIENNNKRIRLLEQMAENLYKEWFVRFRFPGHEKAEFENGLPKGWVVKRMSDFCDVTDGTHDTPKPVDDGVPLITGKCISNGFIDYNEAYSISLEDHEKIKKRSGLSTGDILFSNIGTVGNCCIVDYDREFSVKNVIIFKPNDIIKTAYLYYWMMSDSMQNVFSTQTNGASQQFVGLTFMRRYKILVPEQELLTSFGERVNPIIDQKRYLHRINQTLSRQRDLLLPRLMSGKLEVKV